MKKYILASITSIAAIASYAGQGFFVILENNTLDPIKVKNISSRCINNTGRLNQDLVPGKLIKVYLEASDGYKCSFSKSAGEFTITTAGGQKLGSVDYSTSKFNTNAKSVDSNKYPQLKVSSHVYSANRFSTQDYIITSVVPSVSQQSYFSDWMQQQAAYIQNRPINEIILPGTHDSLTYDLSKFVCPSEEKTFTNILKQLGFALGRGYAVAQNLTTAEQLNNGIRYFDLRLCNTSISGVGKDTWITHGYISNKRFSQELDQIAKFIKDHPKEILVLDLQSIYGFTDPSDKSALLDLIMDKLENNLVPASMGVTVTPNTLWAAKKNIILLSNDLNDPLIFNRNIFMQNKWYDQNPAAKGSNSKTQEALLLKINDGLDKRSIDSASLFVSQAQLTPNNNFIMMNPLYGLNGIYYAFSAAPFNDWLFANTNKKIAEKGNIIIQDYSNGYSLTYLSIKANQH